MMISKLLLCGDKRIEHLILKGGAVEALSFNFPVDHPRPYLPQFVYLVSKLKVLSIIAAENDVTGIDLQRLPSSLEFLIFRFQRSPHTLWQSSQGNRVLRISKLLPNLRELVVNAVTYCCNPMKLVLGLPPSITRLELLKMESEYIKNLPPTLVDLNVAFTSYKWDAQADKLPLSLEKLVLHDVKHGRFMACLPPHLRVLIVHWSVAMRSDAIFNQDMVDTEGWNYLPPTLESFETGTRSMSAKRVKCLPRTLTRLDISEESTPSRALDWLPFLPPGLIHLDCPLSIRVEEIIQRQISGSREDSRLQKEEAKEIILSALPRRLRELPNAIGPISTASHLEYLSTELQVLKTSDMSEKGLSFSFSTFPLRQLVCSGSAPVQLSEIPFPKYLERFVSNIAISSPLRWNQYLTALSLSQITDSTVLNHLPVSLKLLSVGLREMDPSVNLSYLKQLLHFSLRFLNQSSSTPLTAFLRGFPISIEKLQFVYSGKTPLSGAILGELKYLQNLKTLHVTSLSTLANEHLAQLPPNLNDLILKGDQHQLTPDFLDCLPISLTKINVSKPYLELKPEQCNRFRRLKQVIMGSFSPVVGRSVENDCKHNINR
jgi:hypothetical protein